MKHETQSDLQKEEVVKMNDKKELEIEIADISTQPIEKKLDSPQGPGGRVVRGPFGAY